MRIAPLILLLTAAFAQGGAAPVIDLSADASRPTLTAELPRDLARQLATGSFDQARAGAILRFVRLSDRTRREGPAIFGAYSLTGDTLRFLPDFPLGQGAHYRAVLSVPGRERQTVDYDPPAAAPAEAPRVVNVYPSSDSLPANLLKFYVHFSQPVRQSDQLFDQIHILDQTGELVRDPWRRFQQWSDDGTRLTLWVHPGRVKQGVNLREDFGPVLQPNHRYTLVIADLLDLPGIRPMVRFEKHFTATAEDHHRLALDQWALEPPKTGTRDSLRITFPKPLDHALLQRMIAVRDPANKAVEGRAESGAGETSWIFSPEKPWSTGEYTVIADDLLEDLAGNTPARVFDTDTQHPDTRPAVTSIRFSPK